MMEIRVLLDHWVYQDHLEVMVVQEKEEELAFEDLKENKDLLVEE